MSLQPQVRFLDTEAHERRIMNVLGEEKVLPTLKRLKEINHGELGDDAEVMEWMALYENLVDFQKEYQRISRV